MFDCFTAGTIHHDESQEHGAAGTICEHAGSAQDNVIVLQVVRVRVVCTKRPTVTAHMHVGHEVHVTKIVL